MLNKTLRIFLCRHGETTWSVSGHHTGLTDLPLTEAGVKQAEVLKKELAKVSFEAVFSSPLQRAKSTCEIAGFGKRMILEPNAVEWNYGLYEGLTSEQVLAKKPGWNLFKDGCPEGETLSDIEKRANCVIDRFLQFKGNIVLFSHGHFLRVLAAEWIRSSGKHFKLNVASISILAFEKQERAIELWNSKTI